MAKRYVKRYVLSRLCTLAALSLLAAVAACAQSAPTAGTDTPAAASLAQHSAIESLSISNPAVYSMPEFRPAPYSSNSSNADGFSGSSEPPAAVAPFTGTETFPPGASGTEAPGAGASGSTIGQAGG
jgi:hypothetical protein